MNDLIKREELQINIARHKTLAMSGAHKETEEAIACYNPSSFMAGLDYGMELANKLVFNAPTIEAVPVVHGEWIKKLRSNGGYIASITCSVCGCSWHRATYNFCPECGADMRKGGANNV